MIKVIFKEEKQIIKFEITGHAEEDTEKDNNLVCAGVSSVVFGVLNSLDSSENKISILENKITVETLKKTNQNFYSLKVLFASLKTIEKKYQKFINIDNNINWEEKNEN